MADPQPAGGGGAPKVDFVATRFGSIVILTMLVALGQMSMGLYLPSMPSMASTLGTEIGLVQLTLTVFIAGFAVSQLVWGPMSDRFGRRPTVLIGLTVFALAGFACSFAETVEQLIALRFLQAVGACSGQVISRAIVRDTTEGAVTARVMSYIALAMSLSPAITPSLGGFLEETFGWRANFLALGGVGVVLVVFVLFRLPETNRHKQHDALMFRPMLRNYGYLLRDRTYLGYILSVGLIFGCLLSYQTGSPFVLMEGLGWSPREYGLLILFNVVGFLGGTLVNTRVGRRVGVPGMVVYGSWVIGFSGVLMVAPPLLGHISTVAVIVPMVVFLFGMGIALPNAFTGALAGFPRIAGSAAAMMGFTQMGVAMLASLIISRIDGDVHLVMGAVFAACAIGCVVVQHFLVGKPAETNGETT
jgi:DHA1 family bicyclomycin/chloramphenicol resistance-like MFS transporter